MAINIQNFDGQKISVDSIYPNGDIKDETGYQANDGTKMNRKSFGDIFQFFAKILRVSGITPNNLPDNVYNGFQLFEAAKKALQPCDTYEVILKQTGTSAPTEYVVANTRGASPTWVYNGVGDYQLNDLIPYYAPSGSFLETNSYFNKTVLYSAGAIVGYVVCETYIETLGVGVYAARVSVKTYNASNVAANGILNNYSLKIDSAYLTITD